MFLQCWSNWLCKLYKQYVKFHDPGLPPLHPPPKSTTSIYYDRKKIVSSRKQSHVLSDYNFKINVNVERNHHAFKKTRDDKREM